MRKRYKEKRHSCAFCKPHKMRGACRWSDKDFAMLKEFEKRRLNYIHTPVFLNVLKYNQA